MERKNNLHPKLTLNWKWLVGAFLVVLFGLSFFTFKSYYSVKAPDTAEIEVIDSADYGYTDEDVVAVGEDLPKIKKFNEDEAQRVDYVTVLDDRQERRKERMNWRKSVVDLLKLIFKPSSMAARNKMADDLGYDGPDGSYERNLWLHSRVQRGLSTGEIPLGEEK